MFEGLIRKIVKEEIDKTINSFDFKEMIDYSSRNIICELFKNDKDKEVIYTYWHNSMEVNTIVDLLKCGIAEKVLNDINKQNNKTINDKVNSNDFIDLFVKKINDKQLIK